VAVEHATSVPKAHPASVCVSSGDVRAASVPKADPALACARSGDEHATSVGQADPASACASSDDVRAASVPKADPALACARSGDEHATSVGQADPASACTSSDDVRAASVGKTGMSAGSPARGTGGRARWVPAQLARDRLAVALGVAVTLGAGVLYSLLLPFAFTQRVSFGNWSYLDVEEGVAASAYAIGLGLAVALQVHATRLLVRSRCGSTLVGGRSPVPSEIGAGSPVPSEIGGIEPAALRGVSDQQELRPSRGATPDRSGASWSVERQRAVDGSGGEGFHGARSASAEDGLGIGDECLRAPGASTHALGASVDVGTSKDAAPGAGAVTSMDLLASKDAAPSAGGVTSWNAATAIGVATSKGAATGAGAVTSSGVATSREAAPCPGAATSMAAATSMHAATSMDAASSADAATAPPRTEAPSAPAKTDATSFTTRTEAFRITATTAAPNIATPFARRTRRSTQRPAAGSALGAAGSVAGGFLGVLPSLLCCSPIVPTLVALAPLSAAARLRTSGSIEHFFAVEKPWLLLGGGIVVGLSVAFAWRKVATAACLGGECALVLPDPAMAPVGLLEQPDPPSSGRPEGSGDRTVRLPGHPAAAVAQPERPEPAMAPPAPAGRSALPLSGPPR
jgi:hypothetical protein